MSERWRTWWRRGVRVMAVVSLLVLLALAALVAAIAVYGSRDHAHPADAIVVLGGGTTGTPRRAQHAAELYAQGYAPHIVCAGGIITGGLDEATRCATVLQAQGVQPDAISLERTSRSTEENAIEVGAMMARRGWRSVILVTDNYHLWRARWMFAVHDVTVYPSPAQITSGALGWRETAHGLLREIAAVGWYAGKTVLGLPDTHPPEPITRPS